MVKLAKRDDKELAIIYLDVDDLKAINDTMGHYSGDQLLTFVAETIVATVRETDLVGRVGRNEFALCCSGYAGETGLQALMERLYSSLSSGLSVERGPIAASVSAGYAVYRRDL